MKSGKLKKEKSTGTVHRKGHNFCVLKQKKISQGHICEKERLQRHKATREAESVLGRKIKNVEFECSILKIKFT